MRRIESKFVYCEPEVSDYLDNPNIKAFVLKHKNEYDESESDFIWKVREEFDIYDKSYYEDEENLFSDGACDHQYEYIGERFDDDIYYVLKEVIETILSQFSKNMETE